jgi:hypothetical protein
MNSCQSKGPWDIYRRDTGPPTRHPLLRVGGGQYHTFNEKLTVPWEELRNYTEIGELMKLLSLAVGSLNTKISEEYAGSILVLTFRWLMSYIYGAPIPDVYRSHTMTQHSR